MKPPLTPSEVTAITDWTSDGHFVDANGKAVVQGDYVQLTRDIPAYGDRQSLCAPAGLFAEVVQFSPRRAIVSLNFALGDEQSVEAFEKTSRVLRARASDRLKEVRADA